MLRFRIGFGFGFGIQVVLGNGAHQNMLIEKAYWQATKKLQDVDLELGHLVSASKVAHFDWRDLERVRTGIRQYFRTMNVVNLTH